MSALGCTCPRDPDDPMDPGDPVSDCPVHGWTEEEPLRYEDVLLGDDEEDERNLEERRSPGNRKLPPKAREEMS